ncbi:X-Pro dipeptidyl-peptidase-domain-containing protein [Xylariales sp. AK1849]|nr:X-Pro dipeptidyl-peptidase-domain-containing protein [Xylariales sp. AK1849]
MAAQPEGRGLMTAILDRASDWFLGLPAAECSYTVSEVRIPMSDGIHLAADLYQPSGQPSGEKPHGLIYVLCCYGRGALFSILNARIFADRGYTVLLASCRGTFGSEGTFLPGMSEQADSQAIVRWMRDQPWYPGKFATFGASYLGYTQYALLHDPPEDLVASVILCGPHDQAVHHWRPNGLFRMDRISWNDMIVHQEDPGLAAASNRLNASATMKTTFEAVPLLDAVERHFDGKAPYMRQLMTTPDVEDSFWDPVKHSVALDRINTPVLLGSGWYDTFTYQTMEQYERLRARGCKVNLTVGPWTHASACGMKSMPEVFAFLDEHVAGRKKDHRPLAVKLFVTGAEEWRELPVWPPATQPRTFYLQDEQSLVAQHPRSDAPPASFTYNPTSPTPTVGGPLMSGNGGRADDSAYASRSDVLVYTSPLLEEEIEVMGKPVVHVAHTTDIPYADLWVRLSEVDAQGVSHNIAEQFQALDPKRGSGPLSLDLQDCAHLFKKGTRIRLIVAGGSFPLMARNPGTEENRTTAKEMKAVKHTVQHANGVSKLTLPCSP